MFKIIKIIVKIIGYIFFTPLLIILDINMLFYMLIAYIFIILYQVTFNRKVMTLSEFREKSGVHSLTISTFKNRNK